MTRRANRFMLFLSVYSQALGTALFFAFAYLNARFGTPVNIHMLQSVSMILTFAAPCAVFIFISDRGPAGAAPVSIPIRRLGSANVAFVVCAGVLAAPSVMAVSAASSVFFENNAAVYLDEIKSSPIAASLVTAALIPAFVEEFVFRGVILSDLKENGIKKAALLSGFFFGLMHMDPQQFVYAFLIGVAFAYLVYYTGSIFSSVLAHFVINATSVFLGYAAGGDDELIFPLVPALVVSVPALVLTVRQFIAYNKKNVTEESAIIVAEGDTNTAPRILTWEFWAVIAVYLAVVLAGYLF